MENELEKIRQLLKVLKDAEEGVLGIHLKDNGEWLIFVEFGREADDSPMAGGALYGVGESLDDALQEAVKDLR